MLEENNSCQCLQTKEFLALVGTKKKVLGFLFERKKERKKERHDKEMEMQLKTGRKKERKKERKKLTI